MPSDEPVTTNDGLDYNCPVCGNQAYLIADEWSQPSTVLYYYECKDEDWRSRNISEAEYWGTERWHPKKSIGIVSGMMKN